MEDTSDKEGKVDDNNSHQETDEFFDINGIEKGVFHPCYFYFISLFKTWFLSTYISELFLLGRKEGFDKNQNIYSAH